MALTQNGVLQKDDNGYPVAGGVSSADGSTVLNLEVSPATGRLLVDSASGSTPGGSDTDIQFNDSGSFGGEDTFTFDKNNIVVTLGAEADTSRIQAPSATSPNTTGGGLDFLTGNGLGSGDGGNISFQAGEAGSTGDSGGNFQIQSGGTTGNLGAFLLLQGGDDDDNEGGKVRFVAGDSAIDGDGGTVSFESGNGAGVGDGGSQTFTAGTGGNNGNGGAVEITSGGAGGGNNDGGQIRIVSGLGAGAGDSGPITIETGNESGFISIAATSATTSPPDGTIKLSAETGLYHLAANGGSALSAILDTTNIATSDKTFKFPNASGTISLGGVSTAQYQSATYVVSSTVGQGDYTTIQDAIDAIPASGGLIFVRAGTYTLSASIIIDTANVSIVGEGPLVTEIEFDKDVVATAISFSTTDLERCALRNFSIVQTDAAIGGVGISCGNQPFLRVENVLVDNCTTGIDINDTANLSFYCTYSDLIIAGCTNGIRLRGNPVNDNLFSNIRTVAPANGKGLDLAVGNGNTFISFNAEPASATGTTGVAIANSTSNYSNVFVGIFCEGNATGVSVAGANAANNTFYGGELTGNTADITDSGTGTRFLGVALTAGSRNQLSTFTTETITPITNDGGALGTAALSFSDLFLASGALINIANSNWVATHTSGILTVSTGDLRVTSAGANTASVVTVGGSQTLTSKTLTSPTLTTPSGFTTGGTITLAENTSIALDPVLSADGKYTGTTITGTAGATLAFGDLIYLAVADSRWELTDADSVTTAGAVWTGMCVLAAANDGDPTTILLNGNIRADANFPALTVGAPVYASTTAGDIQVAQPSGADDVIHVVGFAMTADSIYFNPSPDYITHT